jgi:hypothetical protein
MSNWWHDLSRDVSNWWHDLHGGNQAEWVTGGITLLTALIALGALIFAREAAKASRKAAQVSQRMWRLELEREAKRDERDAKRDQREARAEQADQVAAWPERREMGPVELPFWGARIRNGSKLPVYNVMVEFIDTENDTVREGQGWEVFPPGEDFIRPPEDPDRPKTTTLDWFRVAIQFRDTADRLWRRDRWGRLEQIGRQVRITRVETTESGEVERETGVFDLMNDPPDTSSSTDPDG